MGEASDRINNRNAPKVYGFVGKRGDTRIKVELRTNPYTALEAKGWGEPLKDCFGAPPAKEVIVSSDLKIRDSQKFEEWLSSSLPCAENAVFWITIAKPSRATANLGETPLDQVSKYAVYERVKDKVPVPYVVTMDNSGRIPIQFPKQ